MLCWFVCLCVCCFVCLFVGLFVCLFACFFLFVLLGCLHVYALAFVCFGLSVCFLACLLARLLACLLACLPVFCFLFAPSWRGMILVFASRCFFFENVCFWLLGFSASWLLGLSASCWFMRLLVVFWRWLFACSAFPVPVRQVAFWLLRLFAGYAAFCGFLHPLLS